jgi:exodeoxyribonuclease VII large subunit
MTDPTAKQGRRALSVRQLNEAIQEALQHAFPEPVWVRGEVQRLPVDAARRKHVYFELHEGGEEAAAKFSIPVAIMGWDRDRFGLDRYLDGSDPTFRLQEKLEVCLLCRIDFYPPFGKVSLKVVGIDPEFSLGKLEARRRQVLAWLQKEGLLTLNAGRELPELPLRVGLITSRGSAAEHDFRTGLSASGYPFGLRLVDCRMQGEQTAPQVVAALAHLARQDCDVVVITRGGGSRADLSWFDQQDLCVAIARCRLPVITAIGHEIDTSLADLCAHTRCKTPTAAAEFLAGRVARQEEALETAAARVAAAALARLELAGRRLEAGDRLARLVTASVRDAGRRLHAVTSTLEARTGRVAARWQRRLQGLALRTAGGAGRRLEASRRQTDYLARQLVREAPRAGRQSGHRLDGLAEKVRLLDPGRLLERGFTLTLDAGGAPILRAAQVRPGQVLRTRFADGDITSTASGPRPAPRTKGGRGGGEEEDPGQQALF